MNIERLNNDQHLTYEELVEYSRGNLSNSEMHRLEQHLIGCELCNEALEGVQLLGYEDAGPSIERIKQATGSAESKGLGLYHYIGIAASVLLITALGFVFLRGGEEEPELMAEKATEAMDEGTLEGVEAVPEQISTLDSAEEAATDTEYLAINEVPEEEEITEPVTTSPEPINIAADSQSIVAAQPAALDTGAGVAGELVLAEMDIAAIDSTASPNVDSSLMALSETAAEEEQQAAAKARMAAPTQALESDKKEATLSEEITGEFVAAEPERGMRSFERYLKRNLEYPEAAKNAGIEGDVILSVTINSDGNLGEIVVKTSLGYGCDEEAIRLVREGPAWTAATRGGEAVTDQVSVTVSFTL